MKRIFIAFMAALMLTACGNSDNEVAVANTTPTATTVITTEATTTTELIKKNKLVDIVGNKSGCTPDIEVDVCLVDISRAERTELINDIMYCDEMYSFITCEYDTDFYYNNYELEVIYENELEYYKVDMDVATTLDEMYLTARKCFTGNYISDDELNNLMFESDFGYPSFKMIDGQLANKYSGPRQRRSYSLDFENAGVVSYSKTTAEVWVGEEDRIGGGYMSTNIFTMTRNSENENWKIDKFERMR